MADTDDQFIREVDDEYRRDRMARFWSRYSAFVVGMALLVVIGVGSWRYWQSVQQSRAETAGSAYEEALRAEREGRGEEAERLLGDLAQGDAAGYRLLARFRLAAKIAARDAEEGAKAYDGLAADAAIDPVFQDLARLRGALLRLDQPDPAQAVQALERLAVPGNVWRHSAREALGLAALKRGDGEAASRWFDQIAADRDAPQALRGRLEIYSALAAAGPVQTTQ